MATRLLPVLAFRNQLPQIVVDELEQLVASINLVLESQIGDTSDIQAILDHLQDEIDDILATRTHNLLSTRHPDTIPDAPQPGALVVGTPQDIDTDISPYWMDGAELDIVPVALDPGGEDYWIDGAPLDGSLGGSLSDVKWQRSTPTNAETFPVFNGSGIEWRGVGSAGSVEGASAYSSSFSQLIPQSTQTVIDFVAVSDDSGPFWSSGNPSRLTVPTGKGGTYEVLAQATWAAAVGSYALRILVNGVQRAETTYNDVTGGIVIGQQTVRRLVLSPGDYVQLAVLTPDAGGRTLTGGVNVTFLELVKV